MTNKIETLAAQPFLKGMDPRLLELLAEDCLPANFKEDENILSDGGPANRFYLILEGQVELESPLLDGEAVHIQTLGAGDLLGWSWLFPPYYLHFDARAITPVKALFFYGTHLRERCEENHHLGYELMKRVAEVAIKRLQAARREWVEHNKHLPRVG